MSQLQLIIRNEYLTDIRAKSFWISTLVVPLITVGFGIFAGVMMNESDSMSFVAETMNPTTPEPEEMTPMKAVGLLMGMFLTVFLMMYGAQIFNKVKVEKCNRIVEVLATCVTGRTMMLAKIISVGFVGLTQLFLWGAIVVAIVAGIVVVFNVDIPFGFFLSADFIMAIVWSIIFFVGGYIFFGSLFAAVGAMTDKNNENQEYVSVLTFILLASFYIGSFTVDNGDDSFVIICSFIPFTAPTAAAVNAITGCAPLWQTILAAIELYAFAFLSMSFAGKIYTSSLLLKGKKFSPKDILTFLRSK